MTTPAPKAPITVALGQFAVGKVWQENADTCVTLIQRAIAAGADLLVLPEAVLARDIADPGLVLKAAQAIDGPFITQLLAATAGHGITVVLTIHTPSGTGRVFNVLVALRDGAVIAQYRKLHLYDAFAVKESTRPQIQPKSRKTSGQPTPFPGYPSRSRRSASITSTAPSPTTPSAKPSSRCAATT